MDGDLVYQTKLPQEAILVMGNEANGISPAVGALTSNRLCIPRFGKVQRAESLNVASATAILLSEFSRSISNRCLKKNCYHYSKVKFRKTPRVEKVLMGEVHGLFAVLSSIISRFIAKTPRIDGENLK